MDEPLGVTPVHPIWSEDRQGFVPAGELRVGERLRAIDGTSPHVTAITARGPPETVYNLEVAVEHVYYVANVGVLVHNRCAKRYQTDFKYWLDDGSGREVQIYLGRSLDAKSVRYVGISDDVGTRALQHKGRDFIVNPKAPLFGGRRFTRNEARAIENILIGKYGGSVSTGSKAAIENAIRSIGPNHRFSSEARTWAKNLLKQEGL